MHLLFCTVSLLKDSRTNQEQAAPAEKTVQNKGIAMALPLRAGTSVSTNHYLQYIRYVGMTSLLLGV